MKLEFTHRRTYGRNRYYPANAAAASVVQVAERVCLEKPALKLLKAGGFKIVIKRNRNSPIGGTK